MRKLAQFVDNDREVAATLRAYADLLERDELEHRLLQAGWSLQFEHRTSREYAWNAEYPSWRYVSGKTRIDAARLALAHVKEKA